MSIFFGVAWSGCGRRGNAPKSAPSASATLTASTAPSISASAENAPAEAGTARMISEKSACRALAVSGKARVDGTPVNVGTLLDGEHWLELDENSTLSLRHTQTSRELKLLGPGLFLPCRHGSEQFLLARGRLSTSTTLGVRPGAEVLIATPLGSIHYGDAAIDVQFDTRGLHLRVNGGKAWLEPADPELAKPIKNPLLVKQEARVPSNHTMPKARADACQKAAEAAAASAARVLAPPNSGQEGSLGTRAAAQMRDRAAARATCSVAAAATGTVADPAERQSLWASIAHSDELWQSVPRAVSAQKN
ncbi:MAG TPA: hypothetical protein VHV51_12090 [Polyangiaceae bacterium]|nr:hypothetical protein [Polyangiaceae bacterium]